MHPNCRPRPRGRERERERERERGSGDKRREPDIKKRGSCDFQLQEGGLAARRCGEEALFIEYRVRPPGGGAVQIYLVAPLKIEAAAALQ
jgi:hypothetical protein